MKTLLTPLFLMAVTLFGGEAAANQPVAADAPVAGVDVRGVLPAWRSFATRCDAMQFARHVRCNGGCVHRLFYDPNCAWWVVVYS